MGFLPVYLKEEGIANGSRFYLGRLARNALKIQAFSPASCLVALCPTTSLKLSSLIAASARSRSISARARREDPHDCAAAGTLEHRLVVEDREVPNHAL